MKLTYDSDVITADYLKNEVLFKKLKQFHPVFVPSKKQEVESKSNFGPAFKTARETSGSPQPRSSSASPALSPKIQPKVRAKTIQPPLVTHADDHDFSYGNPYRTTKPKTLRYQFIRNHSQSIYTHTPNRKSKIYKFDVSVAMICFYVKQVAEGGRVCMPPASSKRKILQSSPLAITTSTLPSRNKLKKDLSYPKAFTTSTRMYPRRGVCTMITITNAALGLAWSSVTCHRPRQGRIVVSSRAVAFTTSTPCTQQPNRIPNSLHTSKFKMFSSSYTNFVLVINMLAWNR